MVRQDGRAADELRPVNFEVGYTRWAEGSVLASFGQTKVLCNVTIEDSLPPWLRHAAEPHGWVTAEYATLPRSTHTRTQREQRWPKGRTQEISRLIGRSLRMAVNLADLGERTCIVDCDVLQADGGTRTAAITGGWLALILALQTLIAEGVLPAGVLTRQIAAVSVGLVDQVPLLDLAYDEDVRAEVDFNAVMTADGQFVELQGTGEKAPFAPTQMAALLDLAASGVKQLIAHQNRLISA
jgi:ribonuclease PH